MERLTEIHAGNHLLGEFCGLHHPCHKVLVLQQAVSGKQPGNDVCGIWGWRIKFAEIPLPSFSFHFGQISSFPPSLSPSPLYPLLQSHLHPTVYIYVCTYKAGRHHAPHTKASRAIVFCTNNCCYLYFISLLTQVSLPGVTSTCSAQLCRTKLLAAHC